MSNVPSSLPVFAHDAKPNSNFTRRTANFHPSIWGDYFLSFVPSSTEEDSQIKQVQLLKEDVRKMLVSPVENNFSFKLNFIDSIQRLGVSYHFEHEIDGSLTQIYNISTKDNNIIGHDDDLHQLAVLFRLLRQKGYRISSNSYTNRKRYSIWRLFHYFAGPTYHGVLKGHQYDVFYKFKDQTGNFEERLVNDIQGMMSLYEAAQLRFHGEEILEEAHNFIQIQLAKSLTTQLIPSLAARVHHILRQSLHKGMPRVETRYYISFYQEDPSHDENLLTFAKLDFNMLQTLHQKEVSSATKWWNKDLNVPTKLPFVRDRIVEGCFWILGIYFEPQYSLARRIMMKLVAILTIIDDMYDAYGTTDELELFTNAIERWDICCLANLPEYMKLCYTTVLDVFEEIEQEMEKQGKAYYIKYAKKEMKRMVQAHMTEARWFHCNHTPTIDEYMQVSTISSCYPVMIIVSFVGMENITEEILIWATSDPIIVIATSTICRLMDDMAGNEFEQERGHVASSLECYMKQHNTSRRDAIDQLCKMVENAWKDINEACLIPTQVPMIFLMLIVNLARIMDVLYKDKDNYTNPEGIIKDYIEALLVNKISPI